MNAREKNQWEDEVLQTIVDLGLARAKPHAKNRLNYSVFLKIVPYGELTPIEGVAFCMAWEAALEKHPRENTNTTAGRANATWQGYIGQAIELLRDME